MNKRELEIIEEHGKLRKYPIPNTEGYFSVTSIINYVFGMPPDLVKWFLRVGATKMWEEVLDRQKENKPLYKKRLIEIAEFERLRLLKESGKKGTAIHDHIDFLHDNKKHPDKIPDEYKGYYQAAADCILDNDIKPILKEQVVSHPLYKYAGRFDLYAEMWGRKVLIDYKTSNSIHHTYGLQLVAYATVLKLMGYTVDAMYILHLKENGDYAIIKYDYPLEVFLDVLKVFNWKVAIENPSYNLATM